MSSNRPHPISLFFGILGLLLTAYAGIGYFVYEPFSPGSLTQVRGRVEQVVERASRSGKSPFVELRLKGDPTLFRIPIETYAMVPDRAAFLRDLEFGPTVTLGVDSVSLRNPSEPVTGSLEAAAFVSTIATPLRAYVTSADQAEWHRENHQAARNMMLFFLAASILMLFVRTPRRSSPAPPARQRASFG
jgi:hypothetical protein